LNIRNRLRAALIAVALLAAPVVAWSDIYGPPGSAGSGFADLTCALHRWVSSVASGVGTCTQPAAADVTGLAAVATSGSATDLGTGTLPNARIVALPIANLAVDPTNAANISSGILPAARISSLNAGTTVTDTINAGMAVATSTLTKTTDTALATIPGLSIALTAGKTYYCHGHIFGVANASGGIKMALVGTGGLTATTSNFGVTIFNGAAAIGDAQAILGNTLAGLTAAYSSAILDGSITVNVAGTLNVQGAQNASFATSTTFLAGSTFGCWRTN
jgi:hypothetical protein